MPSYQITTDGEQFKVQERIGTHRKDEVEYNWRVVSFFDDGTPVINHDFNGSFTIFFDSEEEAEKAAEKAWGMSRDRVREWRVC